MPNAPMANPEGGDGEAAAGPGLPACLEAIQAQAGHALIESTRLYLHLASGWLEEEHLRAAEAIEAQAALPAGEAGR